MFRDHRAPVLPIGTVGVADLVQGGVDGVVQVELLLVHALEDLLVLVGLELC